LVELLHHHLFTNPGFADDQHVGLGGTHLFDQTLQALHRRMGGAVEALAATRGALAHGAFGGQLEESLGLHFNRHHQAKFGRQTSLAKISGHAGHHRLGLGFGDAEQHQGPLTAPKFTEQIVGPQAGTQQRLDLGARRLHPHHRGGFALPGLDRGGDALLQISTAPGATPPAQLRDRADRQLQAPDLHPSPIGEIDAFARGDRPLSRRAPIVGHQKRGPRIQGLETDPLIQVEHHVFVGDPGRVQTPIVPAGLAEGDAAQRRQRQAHRGGGPADHHITRASGLDHGSPKTASGGDAAVR
jgi:hypothetical protein